MNKSQMKSVITIIVIFILAAAFSFALAGVKDSTKQMNHKKMEMKNDMHKMKKDSTKKMQSSIIREGVIDVKAVDKNKDGKVFQDMMDYNVISDKPGKCPVCGMKLTEVSVKKAKAMLVKSGFKVKD